MSRAGREHNAAGANERRTAASPAARSCTVVGLIGGIGSGKSTVARMLGKRGARVLEADAMCAELRRQPEIKSAIRERWGSAVFGADGEVDAAALADIIFERPGDLDALNAILHPKVMERIEQEIAKCRGPGGPGMCVVDAPLLLESGLDRLCDVTLFVECDAATRAARLATARGWAPDEIERREARQRPLDRKRQAADLVVPNSGDLAATRTRVREIAASLGYDGD